MPILHWLDREKHVRAAETVPYRLLEPDDTHSAGDPAAPNMLIRGDNLDALKALLPFFSNRAKVTYDDIPYNTGAAFSHYDDNLENSIWLGVIFPRMQILRDLISEDGSLWVSIDNKQSHYLKIILDEIFGRKNYVTTITWQQRTTRENRKVFSENTENIHVYCKNQELFKSARNKLKLSAVTRARYKNLDNDPRGLWQSVSANAQAGHATEDQFYEFTAPNGKVHKLPPGRCWLYTKEKMASEIEKNNIYFGKKGNNVPRIKMFLNEDVAGLVPETLWTAAEVGTNDLAKKEIIKLDLHPDIFDTPKPESLVERIISIASNPGDIVIDGFLGSGTTAAVAHKMGRRWIGIEMGDHAVTHCVPRLRKVIEGEQGGISQSVNWQGGGGFRFYRLGEPVFDAEGRLNPAIRFPTLAAHVWFAETGTALRAPATTPRLGIHNGTAIDLLYNGILGDKRPDGGNVLTSKLLAALPPHAGPRIIYGEACRLSAARLKDLNIVFRQTPYDLKTR